MTVVVVKITDENGFGLSRVQVPVRNSTRTIIRIKPVARRRSDGAPQPAPARSSTRRRRTVSTITMMMRIKGMTAPFLGQRLALHVSGRART
jgi:hypothetical protein